MISQSLFVFILVQSSIANLEDTYPETQETFNIYAEDVLDPDESDNVKRYNHFMRLGRNSGDFNNKEFLFDDYDDMEVPTKRSGSQHVRFGRSSSNSFMRYGRDPNKPRRNKAHFLRIGRNYQDHDEKIRSKRSADSAPPQPYPGTENNNKGRDYFIRLGKSPSYMRYGRGDESIRSLPSYLNENRSFNILLAKLLASRQEGRKPYDIVA